MYWYSYIYQYIVNFHFTTLRNCMWGVLFKNIFSRWPFFRPKFQFVRGKVYKLYKYRAVTPVQKFMATFGSSLVQYLSYLRFNANCRPLWGCQRLPVCFLTDARYTVRTSAIVTLQRLAISRVYVKQVVKFSKARNVLSFKASAKLLSGKALIWVMSSIYSLGRNVIFQ